MDPRTTNAYVLVYVQKHSLETKPISRQYDSPFIRQLLLHDMNSHLENFFLSQTIQIHITSLALLNAETHQTQRIWKEQPLNPQRLLDSGQLLGIPVHQQDWWFMERHLQTGRWNVTRRVMKRELRRRSLDMIENSGFQRGGRACITLYCRSYNSIDFTTGILHNRQDECLVFIQHEIRGRRQWQDVLVSKGMVIQEFVSKVAQFVRSVKIGRIIDI